MSYETTFSNGELITDYLATAYAEEFCEGDDASATDKIKAWSYLCGTGIGYKLQGFFGRTIMSMIDSGIMDEDGTVNWDSLTDLD